MVLIPLEIMKVLRILFYAKESDRSLLELMSDRFGYRYEFDVESDLEEFKQKISLLPFPHCLVITQPISCKDGFQIEEKAVVKHKQTPLILFTDEHRETYPIAFFTGSLGEVRELLEVSDKLKKLVNKLVREFTAQPAETGETLIVSGKVVHLTRREKDVLNALITGASNQKIADELNVSKRTVETHIGNLFNKTSVNNRTALMALTLNQ